MDRGTIKQGKKHLSNENVSEQNEEECLESRKRISNIIVVDLVKDKKMRYPTDPAEQIEVRELSTLLLY